MFAFSRGASPRPVRGLPKPLLALSVAALLAACSSTRPPAGPQVFSWLAAEPSPPPVVVSANVELEGDGLPPQSPPPVRIRAEPDDPNEPWSPNYGRTMGVSGRAGMAADDPDDAGLPRPMSPEEAGVQSAPGMRREQGVPLSPPAFYRAGSGPWRGSR